MASHGDDFADASEFRRNLITFGSLLPIIQYAWFAVQGTSNVFGALSLSRKILSAAPDFRHDLEVTLARPFEWVTANSHVSWISARLLPTTALMLAVIVIGTGTRYLGIRNWFNPERFYIPNRWLRATLALTVAVLMLIADQSATSLVETPKGLEDIKAQCAGDPLSATCRSVATMVSMAEFANGACRASPGPIGWIVRQTTLDSLCVLIPGNPAEFELRNNMNEASWLVIASFLIVLGSVILVFQRELYTAFCFVLLTLALATLDEVFGLTSGSGWLGTLLNGH